jgi:chromatin assembly factor 1 subunit B
VYPARAVLDALRNLGPGQGLFPALTCLASRDPQADGGEVFLWRPAATGADAGAAPTPVFGAPEGSVGSWKQVSERESPVNPSRPCPSTHTPSPQLGKLHGHVNDVQDITWSADGSALATGGVDSRVFVYDLAPGGKRRTGGTTGSAVEQNGHSHYVMGVAWDPRGEFLASQSGDRTVRVYTRMGGAAPPTGPAAGQFVLAHVLAKRPVGVGGSAPAAPTTPEQVHQRNQPLFHDENMASFFRRLAWAPDGSFLAAPAGVTASPPASAAAAGTAQGKPAPASGVASSLGNSTWLFKRYCWSHPAACLPSTHGHSGKAVAVRFCPVLFKPVTGTAAATTAAAAPRAAAAAAPTTPFELPYRCIFAVATLEHVAVYDTASAAPLALLSALHFAALTDLAWSPDGSMLAIASQDGYCTLVSFDRGELGEPCVASDLPPDVACRLQSAAVAAAKARAHDVVAPVVAAAPALATTIAQGGGASGDRLEAAAGDVSGLPRRIVPVAVGLQQAGGGPRRIVPVAVVTAPPAAPAPVQADAVAVVNEHVDGAEHAEEPPSKVARTMDTAPDGEPADTVGAQ